MVVSEEGFGGWGRKVGSLRKLQRNSRGILFSPLGAAVLVWSGISGKTKEEENGGRARK